MAKSVHNDVLDGMLNVVKNNTSQRNACTAQPATFYEAVNAAAWVASTAYALGAAVRPTARNAFVYEATVAGSSGAAEPAWPTTAGATVVDGTVTWTARTSLSLASAAVAPADIVVAVGDTSGRKATFAAKTAVAVYASGTANHEAALDVTNKRLLYVTTTAATALSSGGTVDMGTWKIEVGTPT